MKRRVEYDIVLIFLEWREEKKRSIHSFNWFHSFHVELYIRIIICFIKEMQIIYLFDQNCKSQWWEYVQSKRINRKKNIEKCFKMKKSTQTAQWRCIKWSDYFWLFDNQRRQWCSSLMPSILMLCIPLHMKWSLFLI